MIRTAAVRRRVESHIVTAAEHAILPKPSQRHRRIRNARLTRVLHAITVIVDPDKVAQRTAATIAKVDVTTTRARGHRQRGGIRCGRAIEIVSRRSQPIRQPAHRHADRSRRKVANAPDAIRSSSHRWISHIVPIAERPVRPRPRCRHRRADDSLFAHILRAIPIRIVPHPVAKCHRHVNARVDGRIRLPRDQRDIASNPGGRVHIAIRRSGGHGGILRGEHRTHRQTAKCHLISARS